MRALHSRSYWPLDPRALFNHRAWTSSSHDPDIDVYGHLQSEDFLGPRLEVAYLGLDGSQQFGPEAQPNRLSQSWKSQMVWTAAVRNAVVSPGAVGAGRYRAILGKNHYLQGFFPPWARAGLHARGLRFGQNGQVSISTTVTAETLFRVQGRALFVPNFFNLHHVLAESVPSVDAVEELFGSTSSDFKIVTNGLSPALKTYLMLLGYRRERLIDVGDHWFACDELLVSGFGSFGHLHEPGQYLPATADRLIKSRERLHPSEKSARPDRIFVSRERASQRRMLGESGLAETLRQEGFHVVDPGSLEITKQIDLFLGAQTVVGLHGMGLSNVWFASNLQKLVEIFPSSWVRPNYLRAAQMRDAGYSGLVVPADKDGNIKCTGGVVSLVKEWSCK